ncbi:hypothetical protein TNIN_13631 [Trichonephila inaurata madagascariensis]|uniref:Uncharacterized protein n=1 Tax=Trichonephila inaurata madagascariensis TaxID=2747483 RepID=A0A8X6JEG3_9ARAC|nr:hypothetical protein TNIN_13631 [Trichonephila inaurata madagascariensis]
MVQGAITYESKSPLVLVTRPLEGHRTTLRGPTDSCGSLHEPVATIFPALQFSSTYFRRLWGLSTTCRYPTMVSIFRRLFPIENVRDARGWEGTIPPVPIYSLEARGAEEHG